MLRFFGNRSNKKCAQELFETFTITGNCRSMPNFDLSNSFQMKIQSDEYMDLQDLFDIYFENITFFDCKLIFSYLFI